MKTIFSDRAYAAILAETTEKVKTETGGLFLGAFRDDVWYVVEAIDPGPKSIFEVAYFEYDQQYTQHLINKVANLYDAKLSLIGLWHRHPGSFDQFSSTDDGTNKKYAALNPHGAISALVNIDPNFRLTVYLVDRPCRYSRIPYEVGNGLIPQELLTLKSPDRYFRIMDKSLHPTVGQAAVQEGFHKAISFASFMKLVAPEMKDNLCAAKDTVTVSSESEGAQEQLMDAVVDDLSFLADDVGIEVLVSASGQYLTIYQEAIDGTAKLYFMYSETKQCVFLSYEGKCYRYEPGLLKAAFLNAKAQKDAERHTSSVEVISDRSIKGLETVIKIIKRGRNGD